MASVTEWPASFDRYRRGESQAVVMDDRFDKLLAEVARVIPVGRISDPIPVPGGVSILAVQDKRQVLTADTRDSVLSLKQMSLTFKGMTRAQAAPKVEQLAPARSDVDEVSFARSRIAEAQYKALARALRAAVEPDPRIAGVVPSTKGAL